MSAPTLPDHRRVELPERPRILVIRFSALGDTLLTFPAVQRLRRAFPDAHIAFLTDARLTALVPGAEAVDETLTIDRLGLKRLAPRAIGATIGGVLTPLARRRWHAAIDLQAFSETALLSRWSRAPVRVGRHYKTRARWLYTHWVDTPHPDVYMGRAHVDTLEQAGLVEPEAGFEPGPFFRVAPDDVAAWRRRQPDAARAGPTVALFVGAAKAEKRWPVDAYAKLAVALDAEQGANVLVCGGPGERDLVAGVLARAAASSCTLLDAGVGSLGELAAAFADCAATVSNDTGPMHLSVAVGTPTVAIFREPTPHFRPPPPHVSIEARPGAGIETIAVESVHEAVRHALGARVDAQAR